MVGKEIGMASMTLHAFGILVVLALCAPPLGSDELPLVYKRWESFHVQDGLPSEKVFCVTVDGEEVWAGTDRGLARYRDGSWSVYTTADGLAHNAVMSVAVDTVSGDVWVGTMGGLTRISAMRFDTFTQLNSGLPNDVVFGVCVQDRNVWVATTAGVGRYRTGVATWDVYTPANAPMHEPWGYHVDYADGKVWAALWGGGVLEFDVESEHWKDHRDPDGEMEIDLFRDDGLNHDITTAVSYRQGIAWVGTYFGLSSYDGRRWRGYSDFDTGLASDFVNFVKARGRVAWVCTDKGLSSVHWDSNRWVTYAPAGAVTAYEGPWVARTYLEGDLLETRELPSGLANNYVLGVDFQGDVVWVATAGGLTRGAPGASWTASNEP